MTHVFKTSLFGAFRLAVAGSLLMFTASAFAQEPAPQPEPQPAETQPVQPEPQQAPAEPAQPAPQQAPAEPAAPQQATVPRIYQAAWEIVIDGKAEANGVLELVYQPLGGEAILVRINVLAKAKKKDIAKDLAKQLAFTTGAACKVKANNNTVKVKLANKKSPSIHLGIETLAVNGVSVRVGKG